MVTFRIGWLMHSFRRLIRLLIGCAWPFLWHSSLSIADSAAMCAQVFRRKNGSRKRVWCDPIDSNKTWGWTYPMCGRFLERTFGPCLLADVYKDGTMWRNAWKVPNVHARTDERDRTTRAHRNHVAYPQRTGVYSQSWRLPRRLEAV